MVLGVEQEGLWVSGSGEGDSEGSPEITEQTALVTGVFVLCPLIDSNKNMTASMVFPVFFSVAHTLSPAPSNIADP